MENVFFEEVNGKKIFCSFSQPQNPSRKLVTMCHGFRGNSTGASRSFFNYKELLVSEGFNVLRFDEPNSGNSEGAFIDSSFNEWVNSIVYFAKKYLEEGYRIVMLGHSMGATAVAVAVKELKEKIPAIILWAPDPKSDSSQWLSQGSPATHHQDNILEEGGQKYKAAFWQEVEDADFFTCIDQYKGGIHLVYGEKDIFYI